MSKTAAMSGKKPPMRGIGGKADFGALKRVIGLLFKNYKGLLFAVKSADDAQIGRVAIKLKNAFVCLVPNFFFGHISNASAIAFISFSYCS